MQNSNISHSLFRPKKINCNNLFILAQFLFSPTKNTQVKKKMSQEKFSRKFSSLIFSHSSFFILALNFYQSRKNFTELFSHCNFCRKLQSQKISYTFFQLLQKLFPIEKNYRNFLQQKFQSFFFYI